MRHVSVSTADGLVVNEQAAAWFERADEDLAAAHTLIDADQDSAALFHLQQAVEKSLEATLTSRDGDYPYTHRLLMPGGTSAFRTSSKTNRAISTSRTRLLDTPTRMISIRER